MSSEAHLRDPGLPVREFAKLPEEEAHRLELSRGRVVREPAPGPRHGYLTGRLHRLLGTFAEENERGLVFVDTGFALSMDERIVRVPDVAFVSSDRIPDEGLGDRFWEMAPDLAVEVVSPSNRASEMQQKALDYLDAGARLVWFVDPAERTVTVYRSRDDIRILAGASVLDGQDALPGFRLPLEDLFSGLSGPRHPRPPGPSGPSSRSGGE